MTDDPNDPLARAYAGEPPEGEKPDDKPSGDWDAGARRSDPPDPPMHPADRLRNAYAEGERRGRRP